jgi:hypothetical protein
MDEYEKKSNNFIGLIIILFIIIGLGVGAFYLFKNREKLDITLPWEEKPEKAKDNNKNEEDDIDKALKLGKLDVNDKPINGIQGLRVFANNLQQDDKGYTFDFYVSIPESRSKVMAEGEIFKVLVDNYETSTTANFYVEDGNKEKVTLRILRTDLDSNDIERFNEITVYVRSSITDGYNESLKESEGFVSLLIHHEISVNNEKKGLQLVDEKDKTNISYYTLKEDKENFYLYFLLDNKRTTSSSTIYIKKLSINGKSYPLPDFKETVYKGAKKCFYLKIPKKDYKTLESMRISFFIVTGETKDTKESYYITNDYTKTFANKK